jgi:hypothetical protein
MLFDRDWTEELGLLRHLSVITRMAMSSQNSAPNKRPCSSHRKAPRLKFWDPRISLALQILAPIDTRTVALLFCSHRIISHIDKEKISLSLIDIHKSK